MPVDTKHSHYAAHQEQAQRVRDAVAGSDAVKKRRESYLPNPDSDDEERYESYIKRAVWLGVTSRTHAGMLGAIFRKAPTTALPKAIDYMQDDSDGSGGSLEQFAKLTSSGLMQDGRRGVMVDYPEAADGLTQEQTRGLKATLRHYDSASIINWRREGELLILVVLREFYEKGDDEFTSDLAEQYRVLRLEDGVYTQQVYRDGQPAGEKISPRMGNGNQWPVIPFQFLGTVNNDETPDKPLLLDIADLNLAHYRNSADVEEASFIVGQPLIHVDIGETTSEAWTELNPNGIAVGSRRGVQTKQGSLTMVQAEERNLPLKLMEHKEAQMLAIGARLIEQHGGNETAEAVRARSGAENANLSTVATNVSDGLSNCLQWALTFMTAKAVGPVDTIEFDLNQEFYPQDADPQTIMAMIQEVDRGLIAKPDYRAWRRKTGVIAPDRTDDDIDADAQTGGTDLGVI
ncbi:DUF4055 domain-containing protein [Halomonas sp. V046]|uniref:DUF4055 domain-containing protein n=1 Tax=Halomonas sp. V046 TaxID=3459611 RepID=UPI0040450296